MKKLLQELARKCSTSPFIAPWPFLPLTLAVQLGIVKDWRLKAFKDHWLRPNSNRRAKAFVTTAQTPSNSSHLAGAILSD